MKIIFVVILLFLFTLVLLKKSFSIETFSGKQSTRKKFESLRSAFSLKKKKQKFLTSISKLNRELHYLKEHYKDLSTEEEKK